MRNASAESGVPIFAGADELCARCTCRAIFSAAGVAAGSAGNFADDAAISTSSRARAPRRGEPSYADGFALLAAAGIRVAMPASCAPLTRPQALAASLGPRFDEAHPEDASHKTELGGVRLDLPVSRRFVPPTTTSPPACSAEIVVQPMVPASN